MSASNNTTNEEPMAEYPAGPRKREPTHPGRIVAEAIDNLRMSARTAAKRIGVTPTTLGNVMACKAAVTPAMALRLGRFIGNGPELWLGMQQDYDLWHAGHQLRAELARIKPAAGAA